MAGIDKTNLLLALLSDGERHDLKNLIPYFEQSLPLLNGVRKSLPMKWQALLRQYDGAWQLKRPAAVFTTQTHFWKQATPDFTVQVMDECVSTNAELKSRLHQPAVHGQVLIANQQNQGRGRQGRTWQSQLGDSLTFSITWTFDKQAYELGALALLTALSVQTILDQHHVPAKIKWPNDLVVGPSKLGGILIETKKKGRQTVAVIGIGINFAKPEDVDQDNSGVWEHNEQCHPQAWLADFLNHFANALKQFSTKGFEPFQDAYQKAHRDQGQNVQLFSEGHLIYEGEVAGVANNGALCLLTEKGLQQVVSGEVSLRSAKQHKLQQNTHTSSEPAMQQNQSISLENKSIIEPQKSVNMTTANKVSLLLDAGNSQLKWALIQDGCIVETGKAPYVRLSPLYDFFEAHPEIQQIVGCAVCGAEKVSLVQEHLPMTIRWLNSMQRGLGIVNHYLKPSEHGSDRWFNILGSRRFTSEACVVVSCGTAITIDALTADNHYLGGSIMPGFNLMKEAMAMKTANLNQPVGRAYPFATSTANAIASGMLDAACGALLLMHQRLSEKMGAEHTVKILLTGGGAKKIEQHLPAAFVDSAKVEIIDNLVIYGLLNWIEHA